MCLQLVHHLQTMLDQTEKPIRGQHCVAFHAGDELVCVKELKSCRRIADADVRMLLTVKHLKRLHDKFDIANAALDAVEAGEEDIYPGGMAQGVSQGLANGPKAVEKEFAAFGSE